jgi:hypothetical protein
MLPTGATRVARDAVISGPPISKIMDSAPLDRAPTKRRSILVLWFLTAVLSAGAAFLSWERLKAQQENRAGIERIAELETELQQIKNPPEIELRGEVFIIMQGGASVKLGRVQVTVFSLDAITAHIQNKQEIRNAEEARLKPLFAEAAKAIGAERFDFNRELDLLEWRASSGPPRSAGAKAQASWSNLSERYWRVRKELMN